MRLRSNVQESHHLLIKLLISLGTILTCTVPQVHAQNVVCQGSFGLNIFDGGDFGSGGDVILAMDPGIAPGFVYTTQVPFEDGMYTLTNDMGAWPDNWPTWLGVRDNSSDPKGYMMVVNASFAPGIFYEQTIDGLCENTSYEVSFDVINVVQTIVPDHILPDVSLLVDGQVMLSTGPVPQDEQWHTYTFVLENIVSEVTITLRNNAPGGIGNDLAIDNITLRPCGPTASTSIDNPGKICANSLFPTITAIVDGATDSSAVQWELSTNFGVTWTDITGADSMMHQVAQLSAGRYQFRFRWAASLDNINNSRCFVRSPPRTVEVVPIEFLVIDTICQGLHVQLGNEQFDQTGIYQRHFVSSIGCDSNVTLDLTVVPDPMMIIDAGSSAPLCRGEQTGNIWLKSAPAGFPQFSISTDQGLDWSFPDTAYVGAGIYDLLVTDRYGCTGSTTLTIADPPPFAITGLSDTMIHLGSLIEMAPVFSHPVESTMWTGERLTCLDCPHHDCTTCCRPSLYTVCSQPEWLHCGSYNFCQCRRCAACVRPKCLFAKR